MSEQPGTGFTKESAGSAFAKESGAAGMTEETAGTAFSAEARPVDVDFFLRLQGSSEFFLLLQGSVGKLTLQG